MEVTFRTFGHISSYTKSKELRMDFAGNTVQDFLDDVLADRSEFAVSSIRRARHLIGIYVLNGRNIVH